MPPYSDAYVNLEQRMSLLAWMQSRLGYDSAAEMLSDIRQADEGFEPRWPKPHIRAAGVPRRTDARVNR